MTKSKPKPTPTPNYDIRGLNPHRLEAIKKHAGKRFLDVGCGNGQYVLNLRQTFDSHGCDYRPYDAWQQEISRFTVCDAQRLVFEDSSFDSVLSFETLEHLPDPEAALREYKRVARTNVILTVPNCERSIGMRKSNLVFGHYVDQTHVNFWTFSEFVDLVKMAGFHVVNAERVNSISLWPLLDEGLQMNVFNRRLIRWLLKHRARYNYAMTTLVVAEV